jgi:ribosomal protein L18
MSTDSAAAQQRLAACLLNLRQFVFTNFNHNFITDAHGNAAVAAEAPPAAEIQPFRHVGDLNDIKGDNIDVICTQALANCQAEKERINTDIDSKKADKEKITGTSKADKTAKKALQQAIDALIAEQVLTAGIRDQLIDTEWLSLTSKVRAAHAEVQRLTALGLTPRKSAPPVATAPPGGHALSPQDGEVGATE